VYVFAAGNENHYGGDANQYNAAKLREVMVIAGSAFDGTKVFYSNTGANLFANSPTMGRTRSTDSDPYFPGTITAQGSLSSSTLCRDDFGGTSSATPLVAGVIALIFQANHNLTARGLSSLSTFCLDHSFVM